MSNTSCDMEITQDHTSINRLASTMSFAARVALHALLPVYLMIDPNVAFFLQGFPFSCLVRLKGFCKGPFVTEVHCFPRANCAEFRKLIWDKYQAVR